MKVLIACEFSGVVRRAFAALGHQALSCDLLPPEDGSKMHIKADIISVLKCLKSGEFDLMIAHPPCTYLCSSGMHWTTRGLRDPKLTEEAIRFVEALWDADIERIAIENPIGCLPKRSKLGKAAQIIQPHQFGDDASKSTCLWLKNLPKLTPSCHIAPRIVDGRKRWANQTDSGQNKLPPSDRRAGDRAKTYAGIATAMAEQWGNII